MTMGPAVTAPTAAAEPDALRTLPAMEGLTFRRATEDDVEALRELYVQLIPDARPTPEAMRATLRDINANPRSGMVVVGELHGRVVATCQLVIYCNLVRSPRVKAQVDSVVVDSDLRGRGIGKCMMNWCLAKLRERNCARIIVATAYTREIAHKLYSRLGFVQSGYSFVLDGPPIEEGVDPGQAFAEAVAEEAAS